MRFGFFLTILLCSYGYGQQFVKLGLSLPQTTSQPPYGSVSRSNPGFIVGAAFNRKWTDRVAFRPEILFIQKGYRFTTSTEQFKVRANYVEVPFLLVLSLMKETHPVMLALEVGPSFGYGFGGKYAIKSSQPQGGAVKFGSRPVGPTNDIYFDNPVDIGIQLGVAIKVQEIWLIDFRYGLGFTSLTEPPDPLPPGTRTSDFIMKNNVLQASLGRVFGGKAGQ